MCSVFESSKKSPQFGENGRNMAGNTPYLQEEELSLAERGNMSARGLIVLLVGLHGRWQTWRAEFHGMMEQWFW